MLFSTEFPSTCPNDKTSATATFRLNDAPALAKFRLSDVPALAKFKLGDIPPLAKFKLGDMPALANSHDDASVKANTENVLRQRSSQSAR